MIVKKFLKKIVNSNRFLKKLLKIYKQAKINKLQRKKINSIKKHGPNIVQELESCLKNTGLVYFATCGTLLGLIREKRLLKNDYDIDYGVIIDDQNSWKILETSLAKIGYKKIRDFLLDNKVTEQTYRNNKGVEIDFFGHFIIKDNLYFYSYDKLQDVEYPSENLWTAYILNNGKYKGTKIIMTDIGMVTVPSNAEEYLSCNYNDDWMIPNPKFESNTGKGCHKIKDMFGVLNIHKNL